MTSKASNLSPKLTEHIARLAHLDISEDEKMKFTEQMNSILEHFEKLSELDLSDVVPTRNPMDLTNIFREDVVKKGLSQKEALKNASEEEEGYIKGPKII